jgi:hypothetical protein
VTATLNISFQDEKALGHAVTDNFIVEAWRFFLETHSCWELGPRGYHMARSRDGAGAGGCLGCGEMSCVFGFSTRCAAIGKWMMNTIYRNSGVLVPLPLDPLFLQVVTKTTAIFDGMSPEDATEEYERLLEGRETKLADMRKGFFYAYEFQKKVSNRIPIPLLVSWLVHPQPLDRERFIDSVRCQYAHADEARREWLYEWLRNTDEMQFRWFLMEATGSPVIPRSGYYRDLTISITRVGTNCTTADVCQGILHLPAVEDRELFEAILCFGGPFLFNK